MSKSKPRPFAAVLAAARKRAGFSQYRLAQVAGVSRQMVSALELGVNPRPYWDTVQRLALALGVSTEELRTVWELEGRQAGRRGRPRKE